MELVTDQCGHIPDGRVCSILYPLHTHTHYLTRTYLDQLFFISSTGKLDVWHSQSPPPLDQSSSSIADLPTETGSGCGLVALILTPTRELAMQVHAHISSVARFTSKYDKTPPTHTTHTHTTPHTHARTHTHARYIPTHTHTHTLTHTSHTHTHTHTHTSHAPTHTAPLTHTLTTHTRLPYTPHTPPYTLHHTYLTGVYGGGWYGN